MSQPLASSHSQYPNHVCRLQKALYGLKQAPQAWFSRPSNKLIEFGFLASKSKTSLLMYKYHSFIMYVLIYVDDIIITSSDFATIDDLLTKMDSDFAVKKLRSLNFFLGIEVLQLPDSILLSQCNYMLDILKRTKMVDAKLAYTQMATTVHLSTFDGEVFSDPTLYHSTIGALLYLSITRPDIAFIVNPLLSYWQTAKWLLRYLKQAIEFDLKIQQSFSTNL